MKIDKKVIMELVGIDSHAIAILGTFSKNAYRQGWNKNEVSEVIKEATSGDYDHLLQTIMKYVDEPLD